MSKPWEKDWSSEGSAASESPKPWEKNLQAEPAKQRSATEVITDIGKSLAGSVVSAAGTVPKAAGRLLREGGEKAFGVTLDEAQRMAAAEGTPDKGVQWYEKANRFNPASVAARGLEWAGDRIMQAGDDIRGARSADAQEKARLSTPDGDITKPSTWTMGQDPSIEGAAHVLSDVVGSMAPNVAAAVATRGRSAAAQMAAGGAVGAAQIGGAAMDEARDYLGSMSDDELAKTSPVYRGLLASGLDKASARTVLMRRAENTAASLAAPVGAVGGKATAAILGKPGEALASKLPGMGGKAVVLGALGATEEGLQEVGEGIATRAGINEAAGTERSLTEGTFAEAILGAKAGGTVGAVRGAMSGIKTDGGVDGQNPTQGAAAGAAEGTQAPAAAGGDGAAPAGSAVPDQRRAATQAPATGVATSNTDEAERALRAPVQLTALDRADELGAELARVDARLAELAPENGYGPAFDAERAELQQAAEAARAEREAIAKTWPTAIKGMPTTFSTEAGVKLDGEYALVDADELVTSHDENLRANPLFPAELQPRDRSRSASELQVSGIVQKLDPARLGVSADAATGAPIVGADGLVESGNARTIALKRVYQAQGQKAEDYKAWLRQSAEQFGITPEAVDGMRKPVLVRVRSTPVNRAEFARQANQSTIQRMSPSEQAMADAKRLASLEGLNPDDNGDFTSSHDFIRQFMATLPITEQSDMIESDGRLSTTGYRRMQNAVLAKAYGDSPTLRRMTESLDNNLVNISKALTRAAPVIASARDRIAAGGLFDADISGELVQAVEGLSAIKDKGWTVAQELGQTDLTGPKYSPEAAELLQFLADNVRSPRRIAEFLQRYYEALEAAGDPNQGSLLGDTVAPARSDLLKNAKGTTDGLQDQGAGDVAGQDRQQPQDAQGGGQGAEPDEGRPGQDAGAGQQGAEGGEAGQSGELSDQPAGVDERADAAKNSASERSNQTDTGPDAPSAGRAESDLPSSDSANQPSPGISTKKPPSERSPKRQPSGNLSGVSMDPPGAPILPARPRTVDRDFWSYAREQGYAPKDISVGSELHTRLKAEFEALKAGKARLKAMTGKKLGEGWAEFTKAAGALGVPRANMPQIKAEHRGALTQFLAARDITHQAEADLDAMTLRPTQVEFNLDKVKAAQDYEGGERSILISADSYVLDGHHQWLAKLAQGLPIRAIRFDAPMADLLPVVREFPSAGVSDGVVPASQEDDQATKAREVLEKSGVVGREPISDEVLEDLGLLRKVGDRWKYKFSIEGGFFTANSKEDAVERATDAYYKAPADQRLTSVQRAEKADAELIKEMDRAYGGMSLAELRQRYERIGGDIASLQSAGVGEFNGNGGRRTRAATSNEAARAAGEERLRLGIYIKHRESIESPALTAPTRSDIEAQQDRAEQADKTDARAQVQRESEAGAGLFELAREEGRQDTTGGLFDAPAPAPAPAVTPNTIFTEDAAEKARARLRKKIGQLNSGIDPEMMMDGITLAGYHIEKGARTFAAYAKAMVADLGEGVKPYLKSWYMGVKYDPRAGAFDGMDGAAAVESANIDALTAQETQDAASTDQRVERNRGESATEPALGDPVQGDGRGTAGPAGEAGGQAGREDGGGQPNFARVQADGTTARGKRRNQRVPARNGPAADADIATGADFRERGPDIGIEGVPPDAIPAGEVAGAAVRRVEDVDLRAKQRKADATPVKLGDIDNIRATLPYLLEGQQDDVQMAEQQFAKPDGYGMLFTNGTGTGKTFSGLGIVKRFARQGKTNTLIVVPDDKIASDWVESARALGLTVNRLENTKDAGTGVVITTYANLGDNDALASRQWDLTVADEAHSLMQSADGKMTGYLENLRAITYHQDGAYQRYTMLNRPDIDELGRVSEQITANNRQLNNPDTMDAMMTDLRSQNEKLQAQADALSKKLRQALEAVRAEVKERQGAERTRSVFLSATPFAYEKTIDWANGYLFDYNEGQPEDGPSGTGGRSYNSGSNRERFFMQHFGYTMRYNKLTEPDGRKVDRGLMQRQFNGMLKKRGSLAGRMLDVKADYDRRFVLVDSAVGNQIDGAIEWIEQQRKAHYELHKDKKGNETPPNGYDMLQSRLNDTLYGPQGHLLRRYLLEAIKAKEVVPLIKQHMAMGRKVVVFHDFKKGGAVNPFAFTTRSEAEVQGIDVADEKASALEKIRAYNTAVTEFNAKFKDLAAGTALADLASPIERFKKEFPDVLLINGDEKKTDLLQRYKTFNDDAKGPAVALVQSAKNKGWSGHDTTGKHPRVLFNLGLPTQPTLSIQQEGRIYRTGQVSNAMFRYLNTGTNWERWAFAQTIADRASAAENLGMGELARALKDGFITAFEESDAYPPGHEGEGTGGKERDKAANNALSEWDRSKSFYWGTQKKNSKTKAQEGTDYFATPEPVGLKMVQWLNLRGGEESLEPSGGHGAIARWLPETTKRTVIEPSTALRSRLAMVMNPAEDRILDGQFEDLHVNNKFDGIAMNPPFGSGGKTAIEHVAKAATHLRDGGRIVALIPTGPAADKRFDKWFYETEQRPLKPAMKHPTLGDIYVGDTIKSNASWAPSGVISGVRPDGSAVLVRTPAGGAATMVSIQALTAVEPTGKRTVDVRPAESLHLVADIKLPQVTFERAGTNVATRIVVIEKQTDAALAPSQTMARDLSDITDIGKLFDRLEDMDVPARTMTKAQEESVAQPVAPAPRASGRALKAEVAPTVDRGDAKVIEHTTGKGKVIRGIIRADLTKEKAQEIDPYTFKKDGGWFIREKYLKDASDGTRLSLRDKGGPTDRLDFPKLQALAQRLKARMPNMPKVNVLEDPSKAPKALREYIIRQDAWYDVEGAMHDGELYLFASGLVDEARAEHVLLEHEAAHYGLRAVLGPSLKTAMRLVYMQNASVRRAVAELQKRGKLSDVVATEEVIVDIPTAELARLKGWRKVVDQVRAWLADRGYTALSDRLAGWLQSTLSQQQRADLFVAELVRAARGYVAGNVPATSPVGMGTRLSGTLAEDIERQEKWLQAEARARGYKDIEDLLARDYPLFEKLAALWRKKNPADSLLSRGTLSPMPENQAPGPQGDVQQGAEQGNAVAEFQSRLIAAQDMADAVRSTGQRLQVRGDGYITLYHSTSNNNADAIRQSGSFRGNTWFSASKAATIEHAKPKHGKNLATLEIPVDPRDIEFSTGSGEFYAPNGLQRSENGYWFATNNQSAPDTGGARLSRAAPPAGTEAKTAADRAEAIIQKRAGGAAPLDRLAKLSTRVTGIDRLTGAIYNKAGGLLARLTPEKVKAGLVSDYGVPEAVIDQRILLQGRQRVQLRKVGSLIEKLATLTREESRVAYEWMNMDGSDPKAYLSAMQGLPEESVQVLQDVQKMIDDLSQEAVRLGQLDPESFKRNRFAYLRRSYAKHILDQTTGDKAKRARVISILGDQYKGRGLVQAELMAKMQAAAPDWWGRKLAAGKADTALKGQKFIRLEKRTLPGQASKALDGMAPAGAGRVQAVTYWPAEVAVPRELADWTRADTWEVRDVKGANVVLWRDFTKDERAQMGEIDEARFAIAKTLQAMVHDVEVGRYLEWLGKNYGKAEGQSIPGVVVEASERMRDTFAPGEWVKVPDTKIPGTGVLKYGKLAGKYLPGPVWNDLRQVVGGGQFKPFGETYATILRWWKTSKTALSPGVHMNNVMSNMVMADWHDVRAAHIAKALRIILAASGTKGGIADKEAAQEVLNRYKDSGGDVGTFATQEIARDQVDPLLKGLEAELLATGESTEAQAGVYMALQHALGARFPEAWEALKSGKTGKATSKVGGALIDLYQAEDDVFRLAAWLKAKEEGSDDLTAGKVARRSFLDYNINAPWVQAMRASAWPFISFTYRAVPMLAEIAGKKPYKLMKLMMLAGGLNALGVLMGGGGDDDERKMLPDEKAGAIWGMVPKLIRMPWNDAHGSPVYLDIRRWVPVGDVFDVGAGNAAIPMFPGLMPGGPLVLAGEVVLNKSAFTGKAITLETDTGAEKAAKLGDYLYKAFAPNLLGLPNTYATEGVAGSLTGRTDAFGREMSTAQAMASAFGVKLGSYPADVLRRNVAAAGQAQESEIQRTIAQLKRQYMTGRITREEFDEAAEVQSEKLRELGERLREKLN